MFNSFWFWLGIYIVGILLSIFIFGFLAGETTAPKSLQRKHWEIVYVCHVWPLVLCGGVAYLVWTGAFISFEKGCIILYTTGGRCGVWIGNKVKNMTRTTPLWEAWMLW